jgi:diacylglycerol kinase family enzyme
VGNVGTATGGLEVFADARPDDGILEVGVVTADGSTQWLRLLSRAARKHAERSPFVQLTRARKVDVRLRKKTMYELDGGSRKAVDRLRFRIKPGALVVRVPE